MKATVLSIGDRANPHLSPPAAVRGAGGGTTVGTSQALTRLETVSPERVDRETGEVTELLQQLIRNACVNDGTAQSGHELTLSPNVTHGGVETNVIPDLVDLHVDIRTLPGQTPDDVSRVLDEALGDLAARVEVTAQQDVPSTSSPTGTPMWSVLERVSAATYPGATLLPRITVGGTDAGFFRQRGSVAYGCGLMSAGVTYEAFADRFHGNDERIDVESLRLTTDLWLRVAREFLAPSPS